MQPYRSAPPQDDDVIIKPRSRWPLRIAIAFAWGFLAFVYYAFFMAFGRDALVAIPGPLGMTILMTHRIRRTWNQNMQ